MALVVVGCWRRKKTTTTKKTKKSKKSTSRWKRRPRKRSARPHRLAQTETEHRATTQASDSSSTAVAAGDDGGGGDENGEDDDGLVAAAGTCWHVDSPPPLQMTGKTLMNCVATIGQLGVDTDAGIGDIVVVAAVAFVERYCMLKMTAAAAAAVVECGWSGSKESSDS